MDEMNDDRIGRRKEICVPMYEGVDHTYVIALDLWTERDEKG